MRDQRIALTRLPDRGRYDAETIAAIVDSTYVCHIGFIADGAPVVLPTIFARTSDRVYIHGSSLARWLSNIEGAQVCFSVTTVDGIVFARSAFHHSLNYRSVVAFGRADAVTDRDEKLAALEAVVEAVQPGRWGDIRWPSDGEFEATTVLRFPLDRASAKVRTGPPNDASGDYAMPCWAGVVPITIERGQPIADPKLRWDIALPDYLRSQTATTGAARRTS